MDIFFCINDIYITPLCVAIVSILKNNPEMSFKFHVLSSDLSDKSRNEISKLKIKYKNFDFDTMVTSLEMFAGLKMDMDYISMEPFFRYAIADFFPNISRGLYLDADLICNGKLDELLSINLDGYYAAAVCDTYVELEEKTHKQKILGEGNDLYVNIGVVMLNLDMLRRDKMCEKLIALTRDLIGKTKYADQDVINIAFSGKILELPEKFNYASHNYATNWKGFRSATIVHFTGKSKPWAHPPRMFHFILTAIGRKKKIWGTIWWKYNRVYQQVQKKNEGRIGR
jgi:lipopolysaccharide biosynthesis glycosyltransferase